MFVVEAIHHRHAPLPDCMIVREFTTFNAAQMFAWLLSGTDDYEVTGIHESITYEPTVEDVTMDGRYGCD